MSMSKIIMAIIVGIVQGFAATTVTFKQIDKYDKNRKILFYIIISIYAIVSFLFIPNQLRFALFILIVSLILYMLLKIRYKKALLYTFNTEIIFTLSEIIISIFMVLIGINSNDIVNNPFYNLLANLLLSSFSIIIINLNFVKKVNKKINKIFDKKNTNYYMYLFLFVLYLILGKNGMEFVAKSNYYINIFFIILVIIIILLVVRNEVKYETIENENKQMLNYVTKYEKIITNQGKANHEFKNQLMVIRGYVQMNNKDKLTEYLDSIIDDTKKTHSSYLISQLNKFPDGGIKGLLYYKLATMEDYKITYEINVDIGVKSKLNSLNTTMYNNITKILGVLLDNAIDASKKCKNKKVIIDVTKEKSKVIFSINNTYTGKIDLSKIGTGYTTKGKGHGYGLKLVRDIVKNNNKIKIENALENEYYVSRLIILIPTKKKK